MHDNTSNRYSTEAIAAALKKARQQKGMSQRELSAATGVPQAHISKIESNAVDLRLSSLIALASTLDLELALVPRKAVPAVKSITRAATESAVPPIIRKWLERIEQAAVKVREQALDEPGLDELERHVHTLARLPLQGWNYDDLRDLRSAILAIRPGKQSAKLVKAAIGKAMRLRNSVIHPLPSETLRAQRPAYSLRDEDDDV